MAKIALYATPEKLYRYRTIADDAILDRELTAIQDGYIYCPTILKMNDPMEGVHEGNPFMRALKTYSQDIEEVKKYLRDCGIASLSETNFSEPMWAYYAGNFSGICVEYQLSNLAFHLPEEIAIVKMHYSEDPPTFRRNKATSEERARVALSCKTLRWQAEREWRILKPSAGRADYGADSRKVVTAVFVGARMPDRAAEIVVKRMHAIGIPVHAMEINKYNVQFSEVAAPSKLSETDAARSETVQASVGERLAEARGGTVPDGKQAA